MTTLSNQNELYQFNTQKPIADLHDKTLEQKVFREIILGAKQEDTKQDLWLKLRDDNFTWNNLYLGRSKTFEKDKSPKKHNVVVPIIPRCYTTPDRDPAQAIEVPEGWLYIIRQFDSPQGTVVELWRELKSDSLGNFSDVNVKKFKGKDQRKATGQPGFRIIVPYCIDKEVHQLWIAYSEVQWSWARLQSMKKDSKLRDQRMHKLDLSGCLTNFDKSDDKGRPSPLKSDKQQGNLEVKNVSGPPLLYNLNSAPDPDSKNLAKTFKEAIPVVYLDNPIGIGKRLAGEYQTKWQELTACINDLRAIPELVSNSGIYAEGSSKLAEDNAKRHGPARWFEAAALANRYFYSKISKVIPPGVKDRDAYKKRLTEIEEQFIQYQNKLDKTAIEQAIGMPQRREKRKKLVQARKNLVDYLEKELAAIKSKDTEGETQDPPLVLALDDYFTLTPLGDRERKRNPTDVIGDNSTPRWRDNYLDGWGTVCDLVALLGKHEYSIDADLEANPPDGWKWRRDNPAFELLRKLADPESGCPLHSRLFPKPAAGDSLKIDAAKVEDTATAFKKQHFDNLETLIRRDADISRGLNLFGSNFNELMAMRDKNDPAYEKDLKRAQNSVLRLIQGTFHLEFKETEISLAELIAEAEKQLDEKKNEGITATGAFLKFAGFLKKTIDTADKDPTFAQSGRKELQNIRVGVIRTADNRRLRRLLHDLSDDKFVSSGLGGFFGLVHIHNFHKALKAFSSNQNKDRNWELFAPLAASFLKIPAAIKDVKDAAVALEKVARGGATKSAQSALEITRSRALQKAAGGEILDITIKKLNLIGDLIDMGLTLSSFTENLAQNDDAAIADAIGFTGATLGLVGLALGVPVLGWVAGLVGLAAWLAKAFLFKEDTPVELWIKHGPFSCGDEYHEIYSYERTTNIRKVRNAQGQWEEKACTVHRYSNDSLYVDANGILVDVSRPINHWANFPLFKGDKHGRVFLMAGKHPNVKEDTQIGTIGQPFHMHSLLQPSVNEKPKITPKNTPQEPFDWKKPTLFAVSPVGGLLYGHYQSSKNKFVGWQYPHEAYLALTDAVYRPRVTMTETTTRMGSRQSTVTLKVGLPFYFPGKSELYIEFEEKDGGKVKTDQLAPVSGLHLNGSGDFEINRKVYPGETKTFTANVRLDLLGDTKTQLPHEPLFCGSEIETKTEENIVQGIQLKTSTKWINVNKAVYVPAVTLQDMILDPSSSGARQPQA